MSNNLGHQAARTDEEEAEALALAIALSLNDDGEPVIPASAYGVAHLHVFPTTALGKESPGCWS
jgi:hypothetical protein